MVYTILRRLINRIRRLSSKYQIDDSYYPGLEYEYLQEEFLRSIQEYKLKKTDKSIGTQQKTLIQS